MPSPNKTRKLTTLAMLAASALVLNWCLYEWNGMANAFNADYADEVAQVRSRILVQAREGEEGKGDGQAGAL